MKIVDRAISRAIKSGIFIILITALYTTQAKSHPLNPQEASQHAAISTRLEFLILQDETLVIIPFDRILPYRKWKVGRASQCIMGESRWVACVVYSSSEPLIIEIPALLNAESGFVYRNNMIMPAVHDMAGNFLPKGALQNDTSPDYPIDSPVPVPFSSELLAKRKTSLENPVAPGLYEELFKYPKWFMGQESMVAYPLKIPGGEGLKWSEGVKREKGGGAEASLGLGADQGLMGFIGSENFITGMLAGGVGHTSGSFSNFLTVTKTTTGDQVFDFFTGLLKHKRSGHEFSTVAFIFISQQAFDLMNPEQRKQAKEKYEKRYIIWDEMKQEIKLSRDLPEDLKSLRD